MLIEVAASCTVAVVALALATQTGPVQRLDDRIERRVGRVRSRLHRTARIATLPGENFGHPTMGAATVLVVVAATGHAPLRVVLPLAAASLGAIIAHHAVKLVYHRPRPASALARGKTEPAFPSGHTADSTAVLVTAVYVLTQQGVLPAGVAVLLASLIALTTGLSRVALGWHWATDVLGGWLTGLGVAAGCIALYGALG